MILETRVGRVAAILVVLAVGHGAPLPAQSRSALAAVDTYVRSEIRRELVPGASVAIIRGGRVIFARGYGQANVELRVPATDSTVYQSGSVGKQFTAALILRLAAAGKLGLDDPIRRHLPEGPPAWDSVTVRHLLTHTSGIPDYTDSVVDLHREYSEADLIRLAAGLPPLFRPGERWSYSNTGYVLLGAIVRRVSGVFYGDLLRQEIFAPLGLRTARIISEADIVLNRAAGYRLSGDTLRNQEWVSPSLNTTADGSLYLTVHDLAAWVLGWDAGRVLGERERDLAWTPVELNDGGTYPYGFGWFLREVRAERRIGHTGEWQGFRTSIQRFPKADLTVIVLTNLNEAHPGAMSLAIAGLLEPSLVPPHRLRAPLPGPTPPMPVEALVERVAAGADSTLLTPGLHRFLSEADRAEWRADLSSVGRWTALGCERASDPPMGRLGAAVAWLCYARGEGERSGLAVTALYTDDWHVADLESYRY